MSLRNSYKNASLPEQEQLARHLTDTQDSILTPVTVDRVTLGDLLAGIKRRWLAATLFGAIVAAGYLSYYYLFIRNYQYSISLQVEPIQPVGGRSGTSPALLSSLAQSMGTIPIPSGSLSGDTSTLIRILNSDIVLKPIYERFLEKSNLNPENFSYQSFRNSIQITVPSDSRLFGNTSGAKVVDIEFTSRDQKSIQLALEIISSELKNFNESEKQRQIYENLRYVNQEIQKTFAQLDELVVQLNQFRNENRVFRPESLDSSVTTSVSDIDVQRSELSRLMTAINNNTVSIDATRQKLASLRSQLGVTPSEGLALTDLSSSPIYTTLLTSLGETEKQLSEALSHFQPDSPVVQSLEEQRRLLVNQLTQEVQQTYQRYQVPDPNLGIPTQSLLTTNLLSEYINATVELQSLERVNTELRNQIAAVTSEINRISGVSAPYRKIEQRIAAAQQSLQLLLQTRQSLQLQIAQQDFTWRVLSDIDDTEQYKVTMRLSMALAIALILGTVSGVVLALILDLMDSRFLEVEQVRQNTRLPIVGQIPLASEFDQCSFTRLETPLTLWGLQHHLAGATPAFKESFYFLLSHLEQLGLQRTLAVTSARAGEGRTTIAAYLALAAATIGKRVLLVDANLRQPGLHQVFGIANTSGLAELLTGTLPLPNWFSLFEAHSEKLWVLTAGQPQQEPMSLLSSPQWHSFFASTQAAFDLVIIDTAPMAECAETNRLVASVDQALFVVRLGKTKRDAFAKALKEYDLGLKDKAIGIVVNGVGAPKQGQVEGLPIPSAPVPQSAAVS
ncbi:GumC family protein [Thermosynechococcus sp. FA-CM-4201]